MSGIGIVLCCRPNLCWRLRGEPHIHGRHLHAARREPEQSQQLPKVRLLFPWLLFCVMCISGEAQQEVSNVDAIPMLSGALLADSFDGPELDTRIWHRPGWMRNDPHLSVEVEQGRLYISGISGPVRKHHHYVGVLSNYFRETDVVLVARMRIQSSFEKPGRIQHHVHLCTGDWPDFFTETMFGKIESGPPRWFSAYLDKLWEYSGYSEYINPTLSATGKEATEWHEVAIVHESGTNATQNYLVRAEGWKPLGPPHKLQMNHTHVELKVDVEVPDIRVRFDVDDVRLYLNPAQNPATIVVNSRIVNGRPEPPISRLKVRLLENISKKLLGEGITDEGGQARVKLKTDILYPVAATIEVWDDRRAVLRSIVPRNGVQGLYPGDVWSVRIPPKTER
jgi:hypothetical protein